MCDKQQPGDSNKTLQHAYRERSKPNLAASEAGEGWGDTEETDLEIQLAVPNEIKHTHPTLGPCSMELKARVHPIKGLYMDALAALFKVPNSEAAVTSFTRWMGKCGIPRQWAVSHTKKK